MLLFRFNLIRPVYTLFLWDQYQAKVIDDLKLKKRKEQATILIWGFQVIKNASLKMVQSAVKHLWAKQLFKFIQTEV